MKNRRDRRHRASSPSSRVIAVIGTTLFRPPPLKGWQPAAQQTDFAAMAAT
jgi:hypothetical protein